MIYFLRAGDHVKIGRTKDAVTLKRRVATLQTGQAYRLAVLRTIEGNHAEEAWLHGFFSGARMAGEWFSYQETMLTIEPPEGCGACEGGMINPPIHLRLPEDLRDAVLRAAQAEERTTADMIRALIKRGLRGVPEPSKRKEGSQ